jgi:intraflagellar transport protein 22
MVTVELWDVSGDIKYEPCWPIILKNAQGIIFCYNPEDPEADKNLEFYINNFAKAAKILPKQCMSFAHHFDCDGEV